MNCHYIETQLQLIQEAEVGAWDGLCNERSNGLEEQLRAMECAISRIRDEMARRELAKPRLECALQVLARRGGEELAASLS
jgi:hypothetical protein